MAVKNGYELHGLGVTESTEPVMSCQVVGFFLAPSFGLCFAASFQVANTSATDGHGGQAGLVKTKVGQHVVPTTSGNGWMLHEVRVEPT